MSQNAESSSEASQLAYLRLLATGCEQGQFLDVRWRPPDEPMRRRFVSGQRLPDAARLIRALAPGNDVYVGVALRDGDSYGGRAAITGSRLAYIESDANTAERLVSFSHPPTMVVASGSPGHVQVYWLLDRRYPPAEIEAVNRRLALALAGDPACADAARILRPPGTLNHKHNPPRAVSLLVLREHARYTLRELSVGLPCERAAGAAAAPRSPRQRAGRSPLERDLLAIPTAEYVRVLTGRVANSEGKIHCPFHQDSDPSLQLYRDGGGFYCFGSGCKAGGTIFDFAGRLWGINPKGAGFLEIRERLALLFDLADRPA